MKNGEENHVPAFGFLSMFQENTEYAVKPHEITGDALQMVNVYTCDATDASAFLMLAGYDRESGKSLVLVLDTNEGKVYEVCEGFPHSWQ
ncbi:MAG: hypothetical protein C4536_03955 [Actinobacteria bacterium]|nr:MAG: hypothetical protein C4536_03955 [Actinomycetota bacterium]